MLYINLRAESEPGLPARDAIPADILTEGVDCSEAEYCARCAALFTGIFRVLTTELKRILSFLPPGDSNGQIAIKTWNDRMSHKRLVDRTLFFKKVQGEYKRVSIVDRINSTGLKSPVHCRSSPT